MEDLRKLIQVVGIIIIGFGVISLKQELDTQEAYIKSVQSKLEERDSVIANLILKVDTLVQIHP